MIASAVTRGREVHRADVLDALRSALSGHLPPIDDGGIAARHLHRYNPAQGR